MNYIKIKKLINSKTNYYEEIDVIRHYTVDDTGGIGTIGGHESEQNPREV